MNKIQISCLAFILLAIAVQASLVDTYQQSPILNCPNGQCVKCRPNEIIDANTHKCVCIGGLYLVNGVCGQCAAGEVYSQYTQWCTKQNRCGSN